MTEYSVWIRLVLAVLATWRVTHLLAREDGPGDLFVGLRARLGRSFAGQLMDCFYCLSLWVAAPLAVFVTRSPADLAVAWLALSGAACLLERIGQQPVSIQRLPREESYEGENHDVLRTEPDHGDASDHAADSAEERFYSTTGGARRP